MFLIFDYSFVSAETIVLKSGKIIVANIIEADDHSIIIKVNGAQLTYYLDEIEKISGYKDPNFPVLFNVIKDFLQHRFDPDTTLSLSYVSKDYKEQRGNDEFLDYNGLKSQLEQRSKEFSSTLDDCEIIYMYVKKDIAKVVVKGFRTLKDLENGTIQRNF